MHKAQQEYCKRIRQSLPHHFTKRKVLDCGSLDVNGNNRYLFTDCDYTGIDLGQGRNVDVVCPIHLFDRGGPYDTIISTECFEHDKHYRASLRNILQLLRPGGLLLFTCATTGRPEHGTHRTNKRSSPFTNDHYKNLTEQDIREAIDMEEFSVFEFEENRIAKDLYFYGVKKR